MKTVLVTGLSGFIGHHAIEPLLSKGYKIHAISSQKRISSDEVIWHKADLLDYKQTEEVVRLVKPTYLLHLAWDVTPGTYMTSSSNYDWLNASIKLLSYFKENGGQRAVIAGTQFEKNNNSPYPASKRALLEVLKSFDINYAWGRIYYLFGENEFENRLVPYVISSLLKGEEVKCSSGEQIRDFMYVGDVARAFVEIMDSDISGIVDIGLGEGIKIKDLVLKIADKLNGQDLINLGAVQPSTKESSYSVADSTRLNKEVGFVPEYSLDKALEQIIEVNKKMLMKEEIK